MFVGYFTLIVDRAGHIKHSYISSIITIDLGKKRKSHPVHAWSDTTSGPDVEQYACQSEIIFHLWFTQGSKVNGTEILKVIVIL